MQKGFHVDLDRCTGCEACVLACQIENQLPSGSSWRTVYTFNPSGYPGIPRYHFSIACNHCLQPDCMKGCPARAYSKDPVTGAVEVEQDLCIGCRYCTWLCPYDAPAYLAEAGAVHKCTFCKNRLAVGALPACVACCPTGALQLEDFEGTPTPVPGFFVSSMVPAITFGGSPTAWVPKLDQAPSETFSGPTNPEKVSARTESSLVLFTLLVPVLVAWQAAFVAGRAPFGPFPALLLGVSAALVSILHLGKKRKAYRAILNWRSSWLSREVLFFGGFVAGLALQTISTQVLPAWLRPVPSWSTLLLGLAALISMDRVYSVLPTAQRSRFHSAQTTLTAPLLAAVLMENRFVTLTLLTIKVVAYVLRKMGRGTGRLDGLPWASTIRLLGGVFLPLLLWHLDYGPGWIFLLVLLGEATDRMEFYEELQIPTPGSHAGRVLQDLDSPARFSGICSPADPGTAAEFFR